MFVHHCRQFFVVLRSHSNIASSMALYLWYVVCFRAGCGFESFRQHSITYSAMESAMIPLSHRLLQSDDEFKCVAVNVSRSQLSPVGHQI